MKPFGLSWMDSCYQQTLLPNGPWQDKVVKKLCDSLATKLPKQFNIDQRRQILFELVGQYFVLEYFPQSSFTPHILEPPCMTKEERTKLEIEAESWLQHVINKVAVVTSCQRPIKAQLTGCELSVEMTEFIEHTCGLFHTGLFQHLHTLQQQLHQAAESAQYKMKKNVNIDPVDKSRTLSGSNPEVFWGHESNCIGKSVVAVLNRDPTRFGQVTSMLHGRQLCRTLRTYLWIDVLMQHERNTLHNHTISLDAFLRKRFGKSVARGTMELNIKQSTHSPISSLIDNAVVEIYTATVGMHLFKDVHMTEAAKSLNVLYVYDRTYEPYLVYWLFPLQLALQHETRESEHSHELAMYLDLLNKGCFPKWPEIFAIAERVMHRLKVADPMFHKHLTTIAYVHPIVNPKEFLVNLIQREKTEANQLLAMEADRISTKENDRPLPGQFLADPLLFIRKWVGEGFVGVLDTPAIVYVWDQCFMQYWKTSVLEDFCLALLLLLRDKFMSAWDYTSMRQVFLLEPCKLFTVDIQNSWIHIQTAQSLTDVPAVNRVMASQLSKPATYGRSAVRVASSNPSISRPATNGSIAVRDQPFDASSATVCPANTIGPFEIRHVIVTLLISTETLDKELWLVNLNNNLQLSCCIYFGESLLETKHSQSFSIESNGASNSAGYQESHVKCNNSFIFEHIDLSEYDIEQEAGAVPEALLQLYCANDIAQQVPLGWALVTLYQQRTRDNTAFWDILLGQKACTLTPGLYRQEGQSSQTYIGMNCPLQCSVFEVPSATVTAQAESNVSPLPSNMAA